MSRYFTNDPVPSADIRNLWDNAQVQDEIISGEGLTARDRTGKERKTWAGIESDSGALLSSQNLAFSAAQENKESRFQDFLLSSGLVFLGDYDTGPFAFSARNQYIRHDNQYWKLNSATDVGFTTTGVTSESWSNDSVHLALIDGDTLRQEMASPEQGTDLIASKVKGKLSHWVHSPSIEAFGARPGSKDYAIINGVALKDAMEWSAENQRPVTIPPYIYYGEQALELVFDSSETDPGLSASIKGVHPTQSRLAFIGGDINTPAITGRGTESTSGSHSARLVSLENFYIDSSEWLGDTVFLDSVALWSDIKNIQIWYSQGRGMYLRGVTDMDFHNVEVRGCKKESWYVYEPNPIYGDAKFIESSFLNFYRCKGFASNEYGVQHRTIGGNSHSYYGCKFSEGTTGMRFESAKGANIYSPYYDGTLNVSGSTNRAIQFTGAGSINNSVTGGRAWNAHIIADLDNSGQSTVMNVNPDFTSPAGSNVQCVVYGAGNTLPSYHNCPTATDNTASGLLRNFYDSVSASYTPTMTVTSGTGTVTTTGTTRVGQRVKNGNRVDISCRYTLGSGSSLTGNNITLVLPFATTLTTQSLAVVAYDASAGKYYNGRAFITGQGATLYFENGVFSAPAATPASSYPFLPAAGDWIQIEGSYLTR